MEQSLPSAANDAPNSSEKSPFPVLDNLVPEQYYSFPRVNFVAEVWQKFPGSEGRYEPQSFSLPLGLAEKDLLPILGRQSRVLTALSHMVWALNTLSDLTAKQPEIAQALSNLILDEEYRNEFDDLIDQYSGFWSAEQDLLAIAPKYFPFDEQKGV